MRQNHGQMGDDGPDHASAMKHELAIDAAFGFRNQLVDEGIYDYASDAARRTGQASPEHEGEGYSSGLSLLG